MFNRRDFLKSASAAGGLWLINTSCSTVTRNQPPARYFGVHPFVENHPEAVFIIRTKVDRKTNTQALKEAALQFIHTVLVPKAEGAGSNLHCLFPAAFFILFTTATRTRFITSYLIF